MEEIDSNKNSRNEINNDVVVNNKLLCCFKDLLPPKACYFFINVTKGCWVAFLYLFLVSTGLSVTQAGLISGIRVIFSVISSIFVGFLVDRTGKKKIILMVGISLNCIVVTAVPFILYPFYKNNISAVIQKNVSQHLNLSSLANTSQFMNTSKTFNTTEAIDINNTQSLFYFAMFWLCLPAMTGLPVLSLIDSAVINLVKSFDGKTTYGKQRVFAPIGLTVGSLLCGFAIDLYTPSHGLNKYTIVYILQIPFFIMFIICASLMTMVPKQDDENSDYKPGKSILKCLLINCSNASFVVFLITVYIAGTSFNIVNSYLLLLLQEMNISKTAMGFTVALSYLSEVVMFLLSSKLLHWLGGTYFSLCIAIFSYAVRFFIYYIAKSLWYVLPAQLLHSFGFALFWSAAIEYTYEVSPSKIAQSMFSLLNMVYFMVASVIANTVGGVVYDTIGGRKLFMCMSVVCCCWGVILIAFYFIIEKYKKKNPTSKTSKKETS